MTSEGDNELTEQRIEELYGALRKVGLYENSLKRFSAGDERPEDDEYITPDKKGSSREFLIMDLHVGDVAFTKRIQAPEQADFDAQFAAMTRNFSQTEFDDINEKIRRRLAEGKNPFEED
jgi:hypothetical protein